MIYNDLHEEYSFAKHFEYLCDSSVLLFFDA